MAGLGIVSPSNQQSTLTRRTKGLGGQVKREIVPTEANQYGHTVVNTAESLKAQRASLSIRSVPVSNHPYIEQMGWFFDTVDSVVDKFNNTAKSYLPKSVYNGAVAVVNGISSVLPDPVDLGRDAKKAAENAAMLEKAHSGIVDQKGAVDTAVAGVLQYFGAPTISLLLTVGERFGINNTEMGQLIKSTLSAGMTSVALTTPQGAALMVGSSVVAKGLGEASKALGESRAAILVGHLLSKIPQMVLQINNAPKQGSASLTQNDVPDLEKVLSEYLEGAKTKVGLGSTFVIPAADFVSEHPLEVVLLASAIAGYSVGGKTGNHVGKAASLMLAFNLAYDAIAKLGVEAAPIPVRRDLGSDPIPTWYQYVSATLDPTHYYGKTQLSSLAELGATAPSIPRSRLLPDLRILLGLVGSDNTQVSYADLHAAVLAKSTEFVVVGNTVGLIDSLAVRVAAQEMLRATSTPYANFGTYPLITDACNAPGSAVLSPSASAISNSCLNLELELLEPTVLKECGFTPADINTVEGAPVANGIINDVVNTALTAPTCQAILPTTTAVPTPGTSTSVTISSSTTISTTMLLTTSTTTPPTTTVEITTTTSTGTTTSETATLPETTTEIVTGTPGGGTTAASSSASNIGLTAGLAVAGLALTVGGVILYLKRGGESLAQRVVRAAEPVDTIPMEHIVTNSVLEAFNRVLDDRANEAD